MVVEISGTMARVPVVAGEKGSQLRFWSSYDGLIAEQIIIIIILLTIITYNCEFVEALEG